jgi:hypothetical protein
MAPQRVSAEEREAQARLEALARDDKWYLSAGDGVVWAPPFPRWLHRPGFWDEGHVFHYPIAPLYTVALVDGTGASDPLVRQGSDWRPDRLRVRWASRSGLVLTEFRYLLTGGRFCSAWRTEEELGWPNPAFRDKSLVAFTAAPGEDIRDLAAESLGLRWGTTLRDRRAQAMDVEHSLAMEIFPPRGHPAVAPDVLLRLEEAAGAHCCGALLSEGPATPDWDLGPFVECWSGVAADSNHPLSLDGISRVGHAHLALALPLAGVPARHGVGFILTVTPVLPGAPPRPRPRPAAPPMPRRSEAHWREVLAGFPRLACSDPHIDGYLDYRVYGLHLNRLAGGAGRIPHPAVAEGPEYFHLPITYSAQAHMMEMRWASDPSTARGSLLNFLAAQRDDGSLPGRLFVNHEVGEDFYHANWGDAVLAVDALHPDPGFLAVAYRGLSRYADWLRGARDPEGSGMVTVVNHYETGQEYMSRYLAVDPDSDVHAWEPRLRLKGVDVTVYLYQLYRGLQAMAARQGLDADHARWRAAAEGTGRAIVDLMWDPEQRIFCDLDGATGRRTGVKASMSFYPLLTDLLDDGRVDALLAHLQDPSSFATPCPVPSSPQDDPLFSAEGLWKGKRHNCPWNGRVWPMTNSHVVEGLLRQWSAGRRAAGPVAARILRSWIHMMHHGGDPERPNSFEHYNPLTGHACVFRGIDDYQHSWVLDLLLRGVTGVEPTPEGLRIDPLPMGLEDAHVRARMRGRTVAVWVSGDSVSVDAWGTEWTSTVGEPILVPW